MKYFASVIFTLLLLQGVLFAQDKEKIDSMINHVQQVRKEICLLQNKGDFLPVENVDQKFTAIKFGASDSIPFFQNMLKKYVFVEYYSSMPDENSLKNSDVLILALFDSIRIPDFKNIKQANQKIITCIFNQKELLRQEEIIFHSDVIIYANQNNKKSQETSAQIIFGGIACDSKLSFSSPFFEKGAGITSKNPSRFEYTFPEMAGVDSGYLVQKVDSIAQLGVDVKAFPGCQILIAKNRKIIYHRCFGYHTYHKEIPVKHDDIYDLASVTKITGPLPAILRFTDEGKINLDEKFSTYWKAFKHCNKKELIFRDILAHQAQLQAWIPYWKMTVDENGHFKKNIFRYRPNKKYAVEIAPNMYMHKKFKKKMMRAIAESELREEKKYKYSGLAYYIFPDLIEQISKETYPDYIQNTFFKPLGAYTTGFNAYRHYPKKRIIPTENDTYFRNTLLHGYVDDEGCAMMGGISGNAGLFSSANDLAKIIQMYLQMGEYGGKRYISEQSMKEFTSVQFPGNNNRRGLGFDKPLLGNDTLTIQKCYPAYSASKNSFGHSGFTGTFVWADPDSEVLFIFLSNRVHPSRNSRQIYEKNIRTSIHQAIYDAIEVFNEKYQ